MDRITQLEQLLQRGEDSALLRFSLGTAYFGSAQYELAAKHLAKAVEFDPAYSAAWKFYGKALTAQGLTDAAIIAYTHGITVAKARGDLQSAKEMQVFLKRLTKNLGDNP